MVRAKAVVQVGASIAFLIVVLVGARWCYVHTRGVEVRVHNSDNRPLSSVVVLVTGNSYQLGDLPPDSTRSVFVKPTSESGIGISLVDRAGHVKLLNAGGYFEPGTTGTISVDVTADSARRVEQNVSPY